MAKVDNPYDCSVKRNRKHKYRKFIQKNPYDLSSRFYEGEDGYEKLKRQLVLKGSEEKNSGDKLHGDSEK